jgi:hypothetical protein
MRSGVLVAGVLLLTLTGVATAASRADQVARGRYLDHHVPKSVPCHTPRDANGGELRSIAFQPAARLVLSRDPTRGRGGAHSRSLP